MRDEGLARNIEAWQGQWTTSNVVSPEVRVHVSERERVIEA